MSVFSAVRRSAIVARAENRCEYCHLPARGQVATFPIDHVAPRSRGGTNELDNLALTCPHCNARKWCATETLDPESGDRVPYFNPRTQVWGEHFEWSRTRPGELLAKSSCGRATIEGLALNDADFVKLRTLLAEVELFPELAAGAK